MLGVGLRAPVVYVLGLLDDPSDAAKNPLTEATTPDQRAIAAEAGTLRAARAEAQQRAQQADLSIEFDTPMEVGRDYQVTLIMQGRTGEQTAGELHDLQTAVPAPTALAETVWVSEELHAQLSTADFKVAELKGGWQTVVPEAATLWTWTVTPLSEGQKSLLFILEQRITTANSSYVVPVRNYPRRIAVQVSPMQIIYSTGPLILDNMVATVLALCTVAGGLLALLDLLARRRKSQLEKAAAAAAPIVEAVASTEVASPAAAEKPRKRKPTNTPAAKE